MVRYLVVTNHTFKASFRVGRSMGIDMFYLFGRGSDNKYLKFGSFMFSITTTQLLTLWLLYKSNQRIYIIEFGVAVSQ